MQEWYGLTVKALMRILQDFDENEPIVIQSDIGWGGVSFSDFEITEGDMPENGEDFYAGVSNPKMRNAIIIRAG